MDFDFSDEQNMLRDSVRRFIANEYSFAQREEIRTSATGFSSEIWNSFAALGLLALNVPEAYEGLGGGAQENLLVMGALGEGLVQEPYLASGIIGAQSLARLGNAAQCAHWLPRLSLGSCMPILAHDEVGTRFDRFNITTRARRIKTDAEDAYVLDGAKSLISHASGADPILVSALLDDKLAVFIVPRDSPGLHLTPCRTVDGVPAADLRFDGLRLGSDALLDGSVASNEFPIETLEDVLDIGLAALCAEAVGVLDKLQAATISYVRERKQFGQPIGKFQALQHRLADMLLYIEQARSMSYLAAVRCEDTDRLARRRALSAAKVVIGQACRFVGQQAVQLHGGMGVTNELDVSHYFKRLVAIEMQAGCTDSHLEDYAAMLVA